jgi:CheY-like chemotaxis protein
VLRHIFEPFFTTKTDGRGTGLGLSQVYGFAKQSGGYVKVCSQPDVGTTVSIYLPKAAGRPLDARRPVSESKAAMPLPTAMPGETILVVEDDKGVRQHTVSCLWELGYGVFEAVDAPAALEILQREPGILLLFTDLGLPGGIDGKALAERARLARPSLKVLITTGYADNSLIHEGRLAPDVDLLNKPFTFAALAGRIREVLDAESGNHRAANRILVVEDEPLLQAYMFDTLAEGGLQVETAGSFQEALAKIQGSDDSFAGAIIDLGLPDRPGDELILPIRESRPDLPIILATGYANEDVLRRFAKDKRLHVLTKPFNPTELLDILQAFGIESSTAH